MDVQPFEYHSKCSTWHFAFDNTVIDIDNNLVVSVPSMKMSWGMIGEIH